MSLLGLTIALSLAATPMMAAGDLSPFQWEKRVLVIFGSVSNPAVSQQLAVLETEGDGLSDRDLLVLHMGDGFEAVLVGKDGGVKLRRTAPVSATELFGTIDAMPMRQGEMN